MLGEEGMESANLGPTKQHVISDEGLLEIVVTLIMTVPVFIMLIIPVQGCINLQNQAGIYFNVLFVWQLSGKDCYFVAANGGGGGDKHL